jgi:alkaline phosphatase D
MRIKKKGFAFIALLFAVWFGTGLIAPPDTAGAEFRSQWPSNIERPWAGSDFWTNPLQDWRVRNGRLECFVAGGDRNVYLLTRDVADTTGSLSMSVRTGRLEEDRQPLEEGFVGFRVGIRGVFHDYRDNAVRGMGMDAGMAADGRLFIGKLEERAPKVSPPFQNLELRLTAEPAGSEYTLQLAAFDANGKELARVTRRNVKADWLTGGVALVCHSGPVEDTPPPPAEVKATEFGGKPAARRGGTCRFWFRDWSVSGSKVVAHDERAYGPILFTLHTLSRGILKLTAQMAPVEPTREQVALEIKESASSAWKTLASAPIDPLARTSTFRIPGWDDTKDLPYRVVYRGQAYGGTIREDPKAKPQIVFAAFTGNNDMGFPHADVVAHVSHFKPDLLVFTGDQIYEGVGEYGTQRHPVETAALDYLRKWYIFGWEYRDLLKDIPAICLPDDHDVYQGNIWGAGGRHAENADQGGYTMPPEWVNAVQRMQTSHLPDAYDPTPVKQGITVYYCPLIYGGVSVAVIEDRKWKSSPAEFLPEARIVNGFPRNPNYDAARDGDAPGAQLLGSRQLDFLNHWTADWSGGAWMKVVVSQTLWADVTTLPRGTQNDDVVPRLPYMQPGEYPEDDEPTMDHDTDGWPQSGRNRALHAIRRGLALHIAGDQHLGSTVHYGIDDWNDAAFALCVPSVANLWPRRWFPKQPGRNRKPGSPRYTGEFLDAFGNKITVYAVSNPEAVGVEPVEINNRAPGYGIVVFDRNTRQITLANWPRWVDPSAPGAKPYPGWPITIDQIDNGLEATKWVLPKIETPGVNDPVLQVIDQSNDEVVYTLRIKGTSFIPRVFRPGNYTVNVSSLEKGFQKTYRDLSARRSDSGEN